MPSPSTSDVLWLFFSTLFRARYSLLTLALPAVLAVFALWWRPRGTLYSLLLPRGYFNHEVSRQRALSDLFWTSLASCCVAALAGAGVVTATVHGPVRSPSFLDPTPACGTGPIPDDGLLIWPLSWFALALLAAAALPLASLAIWLRESSPPVRSHGSPQPRSEHDLFDGLLSLLLGVLAAGGVVMLIGLVRRSLFGPSDWILPLRPPFPLENLFGGTIAAWGKSLLAYFGAWFTAIGCRGGYLDDSGSLLPSQAELILCLLAGGLVYAAALVAIARSTRPTVRFCTAVYLLVCIGTAGFVFAGVAYFFDRYTISTPLVVAFSTVAIARLAKTDHFFELRPRHRQAGSDTDAAGVPDLPSLQSCFASRLDRLASAPAGADGKRTIVIATASGGGIQASAWSAEVLAGLAEKLPRFTDSLCLTSGVSGGSVGTGCFLAGTYASTAGVHQNLPWEPIRHRARASLLEQVAWGVAFADLPRLFAGWIPRNRLVDRGWAIERLLVRRLDYSAGHEARHPRSKTVRDLAQSVGRGEMPVPLFNATCVQTGQRVIMSPAAFASAAPSSAAPSSAAPSSAAPSGSRSLHMPEDYSAGSFVADPTIATAIRLSATFSYASPVARPTRSDEAAWNTVVGASPAPKKARFDLHLCDGGYADNTGVVAAVEAGQHLLAALRKRICQHPEEADTWRILFVRIEPFPLDSSRKTDAEDGFSQVLFGPAFGLLASRVATQRERADREVKHFSKEALQSRVLFTDVMFQFPEKNAATGKTETPPLSWALSPRQQDAISGAWTEFTADNSADSDYGKCLAMLA